MKRLIKSVAIVAVVAIGLSGCKPSEAAYKDVYESAMKKQGESGGLEGTIYNAYRDRVQTSKVTLGDKTLDVASEYVKAVQGDGAPQEALQPYMVVVGRFKQIFNAREMRKRLAAGQWPDAFIVETGEPLYYVAADQCTTAQEALEMLNRAQSDTTMVLKAPLPYILQPAQLKR